MYKIMKFYRNTKTKFQQIRNQNPDLTLFSETSFISNEFNTSFPYLFKLSTVYCYHLSEKLKFKEIETNFFCSNFIVIFFLDYRKNIIWFWCINTVVVSLVCIAMCSWNFKIIILLTRHLIEHSTLLILKLFTLFM